MNGTIKKLQQLINQHKNKRITVLATTCVGKTTFLQNIPEGIAISKLAPPLNKQDEFFYYHAPLTPENEEKRLDMRARKAFAQVGQPVFGTSIAQNTELIIYLDIDDHLLKKRTAMRNVDFKQAKIMKEFIEKQIEKSGLPVIKILVEE